MDIAKRFFLKNEHEVYALESFKTNVEKLSHSPVVMNYKPKMKICCFKSKIGAPSPKVSRDLKDFIYLRPAKGGV